MYLSEQLEVLSEMACGKNLSQDCLKKERMASNAFWFFVGKTGWEDAQTCLWTRGEWIGRSCGKGSHILGSYTLQCKVYSTTTVFSPQSKETFCLM